MTETTDVGWPISVKAVVLIGPKHDAVVLLRNHRGEWELPGGRLDPDDVSPAAALRREIDEELGIDANIGALIDTHIFEPVPGKRVVIITWLVETTNQDFTISDEHVDVGVFAVDDLPAELPPAYHESVAAAAAWVSSS